MARVTLNSFLPGNTTISKATSTTTIKLLILLEVCFLKNETVPHKTTVFLFHKTGFASFVVFAKIYAKRCVCIVVDYADTVST